LQITLTTPARRITRQLLQIFLTEALTFIVTLFPSDPSGFYLHGLIK
jgi:hypothetical protein